MEVTRLPLLLLALLPLQAGTIQAVPGFSEFYYADVHVGTYFGPLSPESNVMDGAIWLMEPELLPGVWFAAKSELMTSRISSEQPGYFFEAYRGGTFQFYVDIAYMNEHSKWAIPVEVTPQYPILNEPPVWNRVGVDSAQTPEPWMFGMMAVGLGLIAIGGRRAR